MKSLDSEKDFILRCGRNRVNREDIIWRFKPVGGELFCDQVETNELRYFSGDNKPQLFTKSHDDLWNDIFFA